MGDEEKKFAATAVISAEVRHITRVVDMEHATVCRGVIHLAKRSGAAIIWPTVRVVHREIEEWERGAIPDGALVIRCHGVALVPVP